MEKPKLYFVSRGGIELPRQILDRFEIMEDFQDALGNACFFMVDPTNLISEEKVKEIRANGGKVIFWNSLLSELLDFYNLDTIKNANHILNNNVTDNTLSIMMDLVQNNSNSSLDGKIIYEKKLETRACGKTIVKDFESNLELDKSIPKPYHRHIANICEELSMNALKDAPYESDDDSDREPASLKIIYSPSTLIVRCTDNYGSFTSKNFWRYVSKIKNVGSNKLEIDDKAHGAGLGIVKSLHHCHGFFVKVKEKQSTEVSCIIDLQTRLFSPLNSLRSLSFVSKK